MSKLFILGSGIRGFSQITLEAIAVLESADVTLYFGGRDEWLDKIQFKELVSIHDLYRDGDIDRNNYARIHDRIMLEVERFPQVVVMCAGHPGFGEYVTDLLRQSCREKGHEFKVLPGISGFDGMMIDLEQDPLQLGTVILDANRVLMHSHEMNIHFDHYLYHVCSVATKFTHLTDSSKDNHIDLLQTHLLKFYDPEHPCQLICSSNATKGTVIHSGKISELDQLLPKVHFGTTLFIPGIQSPRYSRRFLELVDPQFLQALEEKLKTENVSSVSDDEF
jgi:uncharacterized protein YabN with tetrapyrrole methylase and pyrophosphatase domain